MKNSNSNTAMDLIKDMLVITDPLEETVCKCDTCIGIRKDMAIEHNSLVTDISKDYMRKIIDNGNYTYYLRVMRSVSLELLEYLNASYSGVFFIADDPEDNAEESSYVGIYEVT